MNMQKEYARNSWMLFFTYLCGLGELSFEQLMGRFLSLHKNFEKRSCNLFRYVNHLKPLEIACNSQRPVVEAKGLSS